MNTNQSASPELSLVVPVYNCEPWILDKLAQIHSHLSEKTNSWELVVVDDCSQDGTAEKVWRFMETLPNGQFIRQKKNLGKGGAVLVGMRAARGRYIIFTDCDLAYPLTEMDKIHAALAAGADVAVANRRHPDSICELKPAFFNQVYSRDKAGRQLNQFIRLLGLTEIPDTQAGLKGFRARFKPCLEMITVMRFGFDVELLLIARLCGAKIVAVPVRYQYFQGESTVRIIRDGWRILRDVYKIWRQNKNGFYRRRMVDLVGEAKRQ